ncbi:MAG: hypothetical protein KGD65_15790 [Candidatus Lokiarchaeota archaeon]|nr:hypothetical protein [Candidatus Lokiarchaeota archaeon]
MSISKINYCPYCGKKLLGLNLSKLNYCCFCGIKLKKAKKSTNSMKQCIICHKFINPNKHATIECSFCNGLYHATCIESWLLKYNSCPLCLNVFLMPIKAITNTRRI